ncbi:hypothetical protein H4R20_003952 [Coemansia guatemalensis]|uniref:Uncharacterized protein n=1 Tax=Coemansia guatemalensis TaxID=2761395 RepID=A0A9W8LS65_9FUNG|nr:hypothetical protein H4R20_003952 [Coemansia guatemalensis]
MVSPLQVLVLGRGFVGKYLTDLLEERGINYASTTTDGRDGTIKWRFSGEDDAPDAQASTLPFAESVVVTFPLLGSAAARKLIESYAGGGRHAVAGSSNATPRWIYLGSTRPFKESPSSRYTTPDVLAGGARLEAEQCVINSFGGCVLNLAGLWGGERVPSRWGRFYTTKEKLRGRLADRSLHLLHGADAARAICAVAMSNNPTESLVGRWLVSDTRVYEILQVITPDDRICGFLSALLEEEADVRALLNAKTVEEIVMGESAVTKRIDSSHFWNDFKTEPKYFYDRNRPDPY